MVECSTPAHVTTFRATRTNNAFKRLASPANSAVAVPSNATTIAARSSQLGVRAKERNKEKKQAAKLTCAIVDELYLKPLFA